MSNGSRSGKSLHAKHRTWVIDLPAIKAFVKSLRDAWLVVGITIFCIAVCEVSARLFYVVKERGMSPALMGFFNGNSSQRNYIAIEPYIFLKSLPLGKCGINVSAEGYRKTIQPGGSADSALNAGK